MFSLTVAAVLSGLLPLAADSPLTTGAQLVYQGSVAEIGEDRMPGEPQKVFDLTLFVAADSEQGREVYWHLEENGRSRWPWPERFGSWTGDKHWKMSGVGPALLYEIEPGENTVIPLLPPMLVTDKPLAAGLIWSEGKMQFEVVQAVKAEGREAWEVRASNNYGQQYVAVVDKASPKVLALTQRVFMGMGREHQLKLKLLQDSPLSERDLAATRRGYETLLELRGKLGRPPRTEESTFNGKQLALLAEDLPRVQEAVTIGSLTKVVSAARRELASQEGQADSLKKLADEFAGKAPEEFEVAGQGTTRLTSADLKGKVTVLHFWEYRDTPLKVPYGQTGYLDFLHQQRKKDEVRVYGVAVDARLRDEQERGAALRSVRKFQSFMNLGYPLLLDDGKLLKKFGDPRQLGAELPLFVVIGRDGKISHYHVGNYEVDANLGLKELDGIVGEALKAP